MSYNYTTLLWMETEFDPIRSTIWMKNNWMQSIYLSVLYLVAIYVGQWIMKDKRGLDLKWPLIAWNGGIAVFSILGMVRFMPDFLYVLHDHGYYHSICVNTFAHGVTGFWTEMFAISKVLELGDTAFIIARKRPLIFLHWYHHITVLVYTWHAYKDHTAAGRWFIMMNYTVHSAMYTYYTLRALGFWFPRVIPMTVTTMQLAQMFLGIVVAVTAYMNKRRGEFCQQTYENLHFSFLIYFTYFCLFAHFFYKAYIAGSRYDKKPKLKVETNGVVDQNGRAVHANGDGDLRKRQLESEVAKNGHVKNGLTNAALLTNGHAKKE